MTCRLVVAAFSFILCSAAFGQHWESVKIPQDSIQPLALKFADSLTGYFYGSVPVEYDDSITQKVRWRHYWFRTIDGGKTWLQIQFDTLYNGEFYDLDGKRYYHGSGAPFGFNANINHNYWISAYGRTVIINPGAPMTNLKQVLLVSTDRGFSWSEQPVSNNLLNDFEFCASFADNQTIGISDQGPASPIVSLDYCKTFNLIMGDDIYIKFTTDTNESGNIYRLGIRLACSSPDVWIAAVIPSGDNDILQKKSGLMTLLTTNGGSHWEFSQYFLPNDTSLWIRGLPQYIANASSVYFRTEQYYRRHLPLPFSISKYYSGNLYISQNHQKTSYLYSSDNGRIWDPEMKYSKRAVAFKAAGPGDVWMTLWRNDDTVTGMFADVIAHTTNYGKSWVEDSITLHPAEFQQYDGDIIYFSDPRHGWIAASNESGTRIYRYIADPLRKTDELPGSYLYSLYPNPADQSFTAHLVPWLKMHRIEVYDAVGRKYECLYKLTENNSALIDCSDLHSGYYFVRIFARQLNVSKVVTQPFAVQHE